MDKQIDGWMDGRTDGRTGGRTDGRMGGWMDGWMEEWIYRMQIISVFPSLPASSGVHTRSMYLVIDATNIGKNSHYETQFAPIFYLSKIPRILPLIHILIYEITISKSEFFPMFVGSITKYVDLV